MNVQKVLEKLERLRLKKEVYADLVRYVKTDLRPDDLGTQSRTGLDREKAYRTGVLGEVSAVLEEQHGLADAEIARILGAKVNEPK